MNKRLVLIILMVSVCLSILFSQKVQVEILDSETKTGIPFVNISFINSQTGTITSDSGKVEINLSSVNKIGETVRFSILSYEPKEYKLEELRNMNEDTLLIYLKPISYDLSTAEITEKKLKFKVRKRGEWKGGNALFDLTRLSEPGSEIGTIIELSERGKISDVVLRMKETEVDSFLVEINIYNYGKYGVGDLLQKERIFNKIIPENANKDITIEISNQNIWVDSDIFIALKILRITDQDEEAIFLKAKTKTGRGLRREPLGKWEDTYIYPAIYINHLIPK